MRVTLTSNIIGVGDVGLTLDDARGAEWIGRGLAVEAGAEVVTTEAVTVEAAEVIEAAAAEVSPKVPDFFAPEPPATEPEPKPHKRRRHHE